MLLYIYYNILDLPSPSPSIYEPAKGIITCFPPFLPSSSLYATLIFFFFFLINRSPFNIGGLTASSLINFFKRKKRGSILSTFVSMQ